MGFVPVTVEERHRTNSDAIVKSCIYGCGKVVIKLKRSEFVAFAVEPSRNFDNAFKERRGARVPERKEIGATLISDRQQVSKALSDKESHFASFPFEQGVGSPCCREPEIQTREFLVECRAGEETGSKDRGFFVGVKVDGGVANHFSGKAQGAGNGVERFNQIR